LNTAGNGPAMRQLQIKTLNSHLHVRNKIAIGRGKQSGTRADWGNGQRGFKESFLSLLRMHWDHEPWKAPASRTHSKRFAKSQALGHCAAAFGVRGACSRFGTGFMERALRRSIRSAGLIRFGLALYAIFSLSLSVR